MLFPNQIECLVRIASFAKGRPLEFIGEDLLQPVTHYGVIVG